MPADDRLPGPLARPPDTFGGRAVDVLRQMVLTGKLHSGDRINEVELANALGISRGPLREAIQRLRSEGLLHAVSGRGAYVRTFTGEALRDLYEVRIALETHAIRLAAQNCGSDGIQELRQLLAATDDALGERQSYPEDLDFHQRIVALAENEPLLEATTEIHRQIHLARSRSANVSLRARQAYQEHLEILEHLIAGDADKAANVLVAHLRASLQSALELMESDKSKSKSNDK